MVSKCRRRLDEIKRRLHEGATATSAASVPPEAALGESRVIVLVDADQFSQAKHMQRIAEMPQSFEVRFFSCSVYPSGGQKVLRHVNDFCSQAAGRRAFHETTPDPTNDAADRLMVARAQELHSAEPPDVPFLYVTNDRRLAGELSSSLSQRVAVHWKHLYLTKR